MFNLSNDKAKQRFQAAFLRIELPYEKALSHVLGHQLNQLAHHVAQVYEQDGLNAALTIVAQYEEPIRIRLFQALSDTYSRFADDALSTLDPAISRNARFTLAAQRYIRSHGAGKVKAISETTRQQIRHVVAQAITEGLSVPETQRRILESTGGQIARQRARTIAQTEVHAAANAGSQAAMESLKRPYQKEWISALQPGRTRPWHLSAHGQVVDGNAPFLVGGEHLQYPGDPLGSARNIINCRCVNAYLL